MLTIALSPIYWLLYLSPKALLFVKLLFLGALIFFTFSYIVLSKEKIIFSVVNKKISYFFLIIMFFMFISIYDSNIESIFYFQPNEYNMMLYSYVLAYLTFVVTYIIQMNQVNIFKVLVWPAGFIVVVSIAHIVIVILYPQLSSPYGQFSTTSFGAARTGWSNGIALFSIIIPVYVLLTGGSNKKLMLSLLISAVPVIISQITVGGRGGVLTALFLITAFMLYFMPKRYLIIVMSCLSVVLLVLGLSFDRGGEVSKYINNQEMTTYTVWNKISGNRLDHYLYAIKLINENPIRGVGVGNARIISDDLNDEFEIHNVFLKSAAESGVLFAVLLLYPFLYAFVILKRTRKYYSIRYLKYYNVACRGNVIKIYVSAVIVMSGLIIAFIEPRHIYAGMSASWIWWVALSVLLFNNKELFEKRQGFMQ